MKKNIGSVLALYPSPAVVIGATAEGGKPTWTLVAHVGIIGHDRILVSLASAHYINGYIKANGKFSVNIVDEKILPKADYAGSVSGAKTDKSDLFEYEKGENGTPMISDSPLVLECSVKDTYITPGFESFIASIDGTYVEENCLNSDGKIDYSVLKPVLFDFPAYEYLRTGDIIGKCLTLKEDTED